MTKFHLNPETGVVRRCHATERPCPVGDANVHFENIRDARVAYEKSMKGEMLQKHDKKTQLLNKAQDPQTNPQELLSMFNDNESITLRIRLIKNPSFPVIDLEPNYFKSSLVHLSYDKRREILTTGRVTYEQYLMLDDWSKFDVLGNPNHKIDQNDLVRIVKRTGPSALAHAIKSGRYPMSELDDTELKTAVKYIKHPESMEEVTDRVVALNDEVTKMVTAQNTVTNIRSLRKIVDSSNNVDTLYSCWNNPNATEALKQRIEDKNPSLKAYGEVSRLNKEHGGKLGEIIGGVREDSFRNQERRLKFNTDKVKELGLTKAHIDAFVRRVNGNYLFGASYDERTGVYRGYID